MSSVWFDTGNSQRSDAAWELCHENSKRGRRLGFVKSPEALAAEPGTVPGVAALDAFPLPAAAPLTVALNGSSANTRSAGEGGLSLAALSAVLAAACRPFSDDDPIVFHLHVDVVETLPAGLYRYDHLAQALLLLRRANLKGDLSAALAEHGSTGQAHVMIFAIGELDSAAAADGERGYRDALIAAGRHSLALALAADAAGLWMREVPDFYDREVDTLLGLDGVSRSALWLAAVATAADG
jgi:hypothetical protein